MTAHAHMRRPRDIRTGIPVSRQQRGEETSGLQEESSLQFPANPSQSLDGIAIRVEEEVYEVLLGEGNYVDAN
jgi:hypothetical protein